MISTLIDPGRDLIRVSAFFLTLNVGLCLVGVMYLMARDRSKLRLGIALTVVGLSSIAALGVASTRISTVLFDRFLIEARIATALFDDPGILANLVFAAGGLLAWRLRDTPRWGWIFASGLLLYVSVRQLVGPTLPPRVATAPVVMSSVMLILTVILMAYNRWVMAVPVVLSVLTFITLLAPPPPPPVEEVLATPPQLEGRAEDDFVAEVYFEFEGNPTALAVSEGGGLYVGTEDGRVILLVDGDGNGGIDAQTTFAEDLGTVTGLEVYEGRVFISASVPGRVDTGRIIEAVDADDDGVADEMVDLIRDLPSGRYLFHQNNDVIVGPDDRLYFGVGATSDHEVEMVPLAGSILVSDLDGSNLSVFADGFRNPVGLAFSQDGQLFASENSPDNVDETLTYEPPEEINVVIAGGNYGFPFYYGSVPPDSEVVGAAHLFPAHVAAAGMAFYEGPDALEAYRGQLFVALWAGERVVRLQIEEIDGGWQIEESDFLTSFGRPTDVKVGARGVLFIADYTGDRILRVSPAP